ncbi:pentatricopeptide repeat-containing protein At5g04780, mitochondrial [Elaeis guineensis]|uniref:Pentatricopeptide repeat-containing protein At5g04780, mitochondrial n=1 Tax=Elaeis guineensis var. tenera TaxID=51953 RepID=A0A6J0PMI8_ELAGV|nr:pentatricopeptide repeat-containing protein At5g04780, mitochondrial [Elaeis guineensis]XP_019708281.1 pentatricopeptide repeat-containing protein At5g04780, mitochondrial [Elaeis guineensis]
MTIFIKTKTTYQGFFRYNSHVNQSMKMLIYTYRNFFCISYNFCGALNNGGADFEPSHKERKLVWVDTNTINVLGLQDLLHLCARKKLIVLGRSCHGLAIQAGLLTDILTCNILINLYSKCGHIEFARRVFDRMPVRSIVSWNTMIAGHTHYGEDREALKLFLQMHREGTTLSEFTLSSVLCACASRSAVIESKQLHALALKTAVDSNVFVGTAVLDVYAKCNMIDDACLVFDEMPEKSSVTWSSMVAGYVQNDLHEEALRLFHKAQQIGLELTQYTLSAILSACASLAATIEGTQLHAISIRSGLNTDVFVATALIDVYSRCGCVEEAYLVFAHMEDKNIVLWNAMIAGFSRHARFHEAMILFEKMQQLGMHPNEVTYISVLSACGHAGLVEKGHHYFDLLMRDNYVQHNVLHYSCMVDVLGRAGHIDEAWELIQKMPFKATASVWGSLLSSCRIHGNLKLAKTAAKHLFELEPNNAGNHVLLSNIYAANKKWGDVSMARKLLKDTGAKKDIGKSWIEVKGKVHIFVVGESNHARTTEIYAKLEDIGNEVKKLSHKAETQCDLHDVGEEQKEELLKHHSEKLALAFGLISLPPGMPIRINKNLRICGDCHSFIKLASRITGREIIVRDTNRFHHFKDAICSCRDFW